MNFASRFTSKETEFIKEAFINVSSFSNSEIILTDNKFNIIFNNSRYIKTNGQFNLLDISENFITNNFKNTVEKFKLSDKNHMLVKMIFNESGSLNNLPVDVHICKIRNKKNQINGYVVIIHDISQEVKNRIQRETFIDILSHDLKNPIRANIQILELIINNKFGKLQNSIKMILEELLSSCRFMNYMTDNLLIKYKNEFNLYELNKEQYSLVKLIKEKCSSLVNILNRKHQSIEFIVNGEIDEINIDVGEIGKVINNLIINASEQSSENSKIVIQIENNNENINVSVIDCGSSNKLNNPDEIFEEYFTCSNRFRKIGFGLEFYNCRKIIEAHNGHISAKNEANKGTNITFSLPLFG